MSRANPFPDSSSMRGDLPPSCKGGACCGGAAEAAGVMMSQANPFPFPSSFFEGVSYPFLCLSLPLFLFFAFLRLSRQRMCDGAAKAAGVVMSPSQSPFSAPSSPPLPFFWSQG